MPATPLRLLQFFVSMALAIGPAVSQDIVYPAFGNPAGQTFQSTAATGARIQSLQVFHGGSVDGFVVYYEDDYGALVGSSGQCGGTGGVVNWFNIADNDYLLRIELWYDPVYQQIRGMRLQTHGGQNALFGQQVGAFHYFHALGDTELIGLHGSYGAQLQSLGVTTRPVLASQATYGTGCAHLICGTVSLQMTEIVGTWPQYEVSSQLRLGHTVRVKTNCTALDWVAIDFQLVPNGGLPLGPVLGVPANCTLYVAPTFFVQANIFYPCIINVPNNTSLVGATLWFQGVSFISQPNFGMSAAVGAMIGTL